MIGGVGIDIIEVQRVGEHLQADNGFREKVFSTREIAYCEAHANRAESYAARFAAKEAFLKALGSGLALTYDLSEIEVLADESGKPEIKLSEALQTRIGTLWKKIHVSLSHLKSTACAIVILER